MANVQREKKREEKKTKMLFKTPKFITANSSQQEAAEDSQHKIPNYKQGSKCADFKLQF